MADYYRDFAADYNWLYDDDALTGGFAIARPAVAELLQRAGAAQNLYRGPWRPGLVEYHRRRQVHPHRPISTAHADDSRGDH